ncbi:BlaI/MecI/CopY family transcriptional regulator [Lentisphaerota bacterium ZTH]|nr:BlaI/MecI/CopY family transcriptional regulator [Lentisphaerota bacterium]WET07111.1 BlaI/MecI/CopY family transcriptional regulator [Lentisphaerota bacterium ZTH]
MKRITNNKHLPRLTPAEFEIMNIVWAKGEATVGEILDAVNASRKEQLRRATIRVQVVRLEKKGWLKVEKLNNLLYYSATTAKAEASHHMINEIRTKAFQGSYFELVKTLFKNSDVSSTEIEKIRDFISRQREESNNSNGNAE